jgi:hypothetical protein
MNGGMHFVNNLRPVVIPVFYPPCRSLSLLKQAAYEISTYQSFCVSFFIQWVWTGARKIRYGKVAGGYRPG